MTDAFRIPDDYQNFRKYIIENIPNVLQLLFPL